LLCCSGDTCKSLRTNGVAARTAFAAYLPRQNGLWHRRRERRTVTPRVLRATPVHRRCCDDVGALVAVLDANVDGGRGLVSGCGLTPHAAALTAFCG